jgi:hypothetical protein
MDGNGDGIGDFAGLTRRLDYLESLGVDALWLSPSQPSPNRDDGYDVAYYYGIDSRLGTSGDFADFMNEAGERGIRVLMDLVVNHTSDTHPWFRDASSRRDSPFRDWYVWSDKRPRNFRSEIVFSRVQKTTWSYARGTRAWYFPTKPAIRRLRDRETNETGQSQSGNLPQPPRGSATDDGDDRARPQPGRPGSLDSRRARRSPAAAKAHVGMCGRLSLRCRRRSSRQ